MIRDRPPTTYFWQREPTILKVLLMIDQLSCTRSLQSCDHVIYTVHVTTLYCACDLASYPGHMVGGKAWVRGYMWPHYTVHVTVHMTVHVTTLYHACDLHVTVHVTTLYCACHYMYYTPYREEVQAAACRGSILTWSYLTGWEGLNLASHKKLSW